MKQSLSLLLLCCCCMDHDHQVHRFLDNQNPTLYSYKLYLRLLEVVVLVAVERRRTSSTEEIKAKNVLSVRKKLKKGNVPREAERRQAVNQAAARTSRRVRQEAAQIFQDALFPAQAQLVQRVRHNARGRQVILIRRPLSSGLLSPIGISLQLR